MLTKRGDLYRHANTYQELFANKRVTYYFYSKGVPKRRTIYFYERNFMHLCGVNKYQGGWFGFYQDCKNNRLKTSKVYTLQPKYVEPKITALEGLPKLLEREYVGFSDDSVVHRSTNYGEMVRTHKNLVALGTVEDEVTKNQVPLSLINLDVCTDGMRKSTSNWSKVASVRVDDIAEEDVNMYQQERNRDKQMRKKTQQATLRNQQKQRQQLE